MTKRGIRYYGGALSGTENDHYWANQMFVEYSIPDEVKHPYPLVFFHGAGQTNVNWLTTPDGRMGWAEYFLEQGYAVYLAEQPARGRSAWHPDVNGKTMHHPAENLINRFTTDQGRWPQARKHTQWPGDGTDLNSDTMRQFLSSQVEYLPSNAESQRLVLAAGQELLKEIGPAVLVTHSQAGPFGWLLGDACPELVKGIVAMEPTSPPFGRDLSTPTAKDYGLASLPLHYDPPVSSPADFSLEILKAPAEDLNDGWIMKEDRKLPRLAGIPILLMVSEASYHAQSDHLVSHLLDHCGVDHDFVRLEDQGICGNGHMMMLEMNNLEIAGFINNWFTQKQL